MNQNRISYDSLNKTISDIFVDNGFDEYGHNFYIIREYILHYNSFILYLNRDNNPINGIIQLIYILINQFDLFNTIDAACITYTNKHICMTHAFKIDIIQALENYLTSNDIPLYDKCLEEIITNEAMTSVTKLNIKKYAFNYYISRYHQHIISALFLYITYITIFYM